LLFDWQPERAVKLWKQSVQADPAFPIAHRNLAVAATPREGASGNVTDAIKLLERAVSFPRKYALHFTELDELYARAGASPEKRLALLEMNHDVVAGRDDALSREIGLKVFAGKLDEAIQLMKSRTFRVWEGGSLEVADHWVDAHLLRGQRRLREKAEGALEDFQTARVIPENLPSDTRQGGEREAELQYWIGCAREAAGQMEQARSSWRAAAEQKLQPRQISERSLQACYAAFARQKLGEDAKETFQQLILAAEEAGRRSENVEQTQRRGPRRTATGRAALIHCLAGFGHIGLGETDQAKQEFTAALNAQPDSLRAKVALHALPSRP
jgi:tetratricopeptide (TPR) repeat protein